MPQVLFICRGNICRSPMAERVARTLAADAGIEATFSSAAITAEEQGNPMDRRAALVLTEHGHDAAGHRAHRVTADELSSADLIVAAEQYQIDRLVAQGADPDKLTLFSDFDPQGTPGEPLPDPWYGGQEDFEKTLAILERSIPVMLQQL